MFTENTLNVMTGKKNGGTITCQEQLVVLLVKYLELMEMRVGRVIEELTSALGKQY